MELTAEQYNIINSEGNIKINAVAGSGKTTTIIEYAKARPRNSRILYLAFNKSVKLEAERKFKDKKLYNVTVETAHSLAYKHIMPVSGYKVRQNGYKIHEIAEILGLVGDGNKHAEFVVANHINKFISYFCNSNKQKVQELNYLDVVFDKKAKVFVQKYYRYIETQTRMLLKKMDKGEIDITHDFYLKKFQLSNPVLRYDYILFDEGQDASAAMLDIFLKQNATRVIVGDTHQQIYGWRYAVNSLEKTDFKTFYLSQSFRFTQDIADLALAVINLKKIFSQYDQISITGKGNFKETKVKATLARTNLGLLLSAIEYLEQKEDTGGIYFEGNIQSYTYADDGTSLYDVLNLYNGSRNLIRDKLIQIMRNLTDLEEYIETTEDLQLGMLVEIVKKYGNKIPAIIQDLKNRHVPNDEKDTAEMIFSTVHRSKGMEYDVVQLVNDFITEEKLKKIKDEKREFDLAKLKEEINLLYVAVTRTKNVLHIPEPLVPIGFPDSPHIYIAPVEDNTKAELELETLRISRADIEILKADKLREKTYFVEEIRKEHKDAYTPWTVDQDDELTTMYCNGAKTKVMAKYFHRTEGAIRSRIKKLELRELYG
jgi:F-box protein, helicase, 18